MSRAHSTVKRIESNAASAYAVRTRSCGGLTRAAARPEPQALRAFSQTLRLPEQAVCFAALVLGKSDYAIHSGNAAIRASRGSPGM